jgi:kumamolisin
MTVLGEYVLLRRKLGSITALGVLEPPDQTILNKSADRRMASVIPPSKNDATRVGRGIPDVAGNASPFSGYKIHVDGVGIGECGTSAVAPLYAGLIAIINASLGRPVGYLNPILYALSLQPGGTNAIREINDGISNSVHWINADGTMGGPSAGYSSGPGWNACTGLGVVNGRALLSALQESFQK